MNTISKGFQQDAEDIIMKKIIGNPEVKAVVFISSKSDNFIAGADIDMVGSEYGNFALQSLICMDDTAQEH
jgi:enoyl-CoA hydratase/carnithine racemase